MEEKCVVGVDNIGDICIDRISIDKSEFVITSGIKNAGVVALTGELGSWDVEKRQELARGEQRDESRLDDLVYEVVKHDTGIGVGCEKGLADTHQVRISCFDSVVNKLRSERNTQIEIFDRAVFRVFEENDSALDCLAEECNHNQIWKAGVEDPGSNL